MYVKFENYTFEITPNLPGADNWWISIVLRKLQCDIYAHDYG